MVRIRTDFWPNNFRLYYVQNENNKLVSYMYSSLLGELRFLTYYFFSGVLWSDSNLVTLIRPNYSQPVWKTGHSKMILDPSLCCSKLIMQRSLTVVGSLTVRLVSSFTSLDSPTSIHKNNNLFSFLIKSSLAKLETSCTVRHPSTVHYNALRAKRDVIMFIGIQDTIAHKKITWKGPAYIALCLPYVPIN